MEELQCYNKGCLQKFNPSENTDSSCTYHPGAPVFHDVYKSWSCCKKKTTDFTEFLNIKGCEKGQHNPTKPPEIETPKTDNGKKDEVVIVGAPKPPCCAPRLEVNHPKKKLATVIAPSLNQHLTKKSQETNDSQENVPNSDEVVVGTQCKNSGCSKSYLNKSSNSEVCWYHSGAPIFHEGMKYWSCCERKTSDFDNFLQQAGCTSGLHCWIKDVSGLKAAAACRYDWHQTAADLYVTIYSKFPVPGDTRVDANEVNLKAHVEFEDGKSTFDLDIPLWGAINLNASVVTLSAAKVEIKMKKVEQVSWPKLTFPKSEQAKLENLNISSE